ncbi:MAG TPA: alpha/beta hydrolase [Candidatus Bathyarchaeia archaeon]|nr:alpha/beta hydrolase [Candidatus Bathyarchaeia archaeon]
MKNRLDTMQSQKLEIVYKDHPLQIDYFIRRGEEETVMYLHGLGCSKNDFFEAVSRAELQSYTLVAFDFPGCGNSPYSENISLGIDDLVELTHLVVSALPIDDFVIIGHSMGGLVALLFVERYGEHVKGFINVEGNLAPEDCFFSREVAQHSFTHFTTTAFKDIKHRLACSKNQGFRKYAETLESCASEKAFFDCCPSLVDYSDHGTLIQRFIALKIPTMFVYGSENRTLSYLPTLKESGCELVEIPRSNHFPGYDNPRAFYQVIAKFLQKNFSSV